MHKTSILSIEPVTHDVKRFRLRRPDGFDYLPGDATEIALDRDEWREEKHPFTMTSLPSDEYLEFTIKGYPDHDGLTVRLHALAPGDSVLIDDPFKTFRHDGPAVYIAGGAGLTPFLAILRDLRSKGELAGNQLIFANKARADIIHEDELAAMDGLDITHVLSQEQADGYRHGHVDATLIKSVVPELSKHFHLCGPPKMQDAVQAALEELGVESDSISWSE